VASSSKSKWFNDDDTNTQKLILKKHRSITETSRHSYRGVTKVLNLSYYLQSHAHTQLFKGHFPKLAIYPFDLPSYLCQNDNKLVCKLCASFCVNPELIKSSCIPNVSSSLSSTNISGQYLTWSLTSFTLHMHVLVHSTFPPDNQVDCFQTQHLSESSTLYFLSLSDIMSSSF